MKKTVIAILFMLLLAACTDDVHPEALAAFNEYRQGIGLDMSDEQAACFVGIHQDIYGGEAVVRMFREPREWNREALASGNWEQIQRNAEMAGQRVVAECGLE
jgi:hypothetical protein